MKSLPALVRTTHLATHARMIEPPPRPPLSIRAFPVRRRGMHGLVLALALIALSRPALALQPLDAFLSSARTRNADALEASANLEVQKAQSDVALGRVLPGVAARGSLTRNEYDSIIDLSPGVRVTIVPLHQWDGAATLTVPLIDAAGFVRAAAASTGAGAAQQQLAATRLLVESQVVQGYYQLVANAALVNAAQQALDVSRENLRLAQNRYQAGAGPILDVDRATAEVEAQTQQLSSAQLQVALAARALESASGLAPDAVAAGPLADDLHAEPPLASFESQAERHPAVAAAAEATHSAEQQASAQRFTLVPAVFGTFTERGTSAPGFTGHNWTWQAALNFNWALDFTTRAAVKAADAAADASRAREIRARLATRDAIHRQWETVAAAIARSRSARAGRAAALHAAQTARDRFQAGTATQLDVLQAQRDAFSADVARIQADADLINARAQLRLAAGSTLAENEAQ